MYGSQPRAVQACSVRINAHCHSAFVCAKKLLSRDVELVRVRFIDLQRGEFESILRVEDGHYTATLWHEAVRLGLA
jgi:hypothetical protein